MGLTMSERRSMVRESAKRYQRAKKKEKGNILNEFVELSGYNRKYAIHILANEGKVTWKYKPGDPVGVRMQVSHQGGKRPRAGRKRVYDEAVRNSILKIWRYFDHMCSKLLKVFLVINIDDLYRSKWLRLAPQCRDKLLSISAATIDRMLVAERKEWKKLKGSCRTKPGSMLRNQIPIRVFYNWEERVPGFFEMDTVSHDGGFEVKECCHTLTLTDVSVGWTELRSVMNKAARWITEQLGDMREEIPYPNPAESTSRYPVHPSVLMRDPGSTMDNKAVLMEAAEASGITDKRILPILFKPFSCEATSTNCFPSAPRPRFPGFFPPIRVSSTWTVPDKRSLPGRIIARRNLCSQDHAVR